MKDVKKNPDAQESLVVNHLRRNSILILIAIIFGAYILSAQNNGKKWEDLDHNNFDEQSINVNNDWMPLQPGMRYVYAGTTVNDEDEVEPHRVIIHVTDLTKKIDGINALVTYDLDYSAGILVEAEIAFFAQDKDGNVWRLGEYPEEYDEEGEIDEAPCWLAGVQEAKAGISMLANPFVEMNYSQGWAPAVDFTDRGEVYQMGEKACVPMGCYENVLVISETSEDEPGAFQLKYWAAGVGNIQVGFKGDDQTQELLELVDVTQMCDDDLATIREKANQLESNAYDNRQSNRVFGSTSRMVKR